jgi:hypothetical protein
MTPMMNARNGMAIVNVGSSTLMILSTTVHGGKVRGNPFPMIKVKGAPSFQERQFSQTRISLNSLSMRQI